MSIFARLRYALYLTVVLWAAFGLAVMLASADSIALLPSSAGDLISNPIYLLALYVVSFVVGPWLAQRVPIKRRWQEW